MFDVSDSLFTKDVVIHELIEAHGDGEIDSLDVIGDRQHRRKLRHVHIVVE